MENINFNLKESIDNISSFPLGKPKFPSFNEALTIIQQISESKYNIKEKKWSYQGGEIANETHIGKILDILYYLQHSESETKQEKKLIEEPLSVSIAKLSSNRELFKLILFEKLPSKLQLSILKKLILNNESINFLITQIDGNSEEGQKALIEIFKHTPKKSYSIKVLYEKFQNFSEYIKSDEAQKNLIDIALEIAEKDSYVCLNHLKDFPIDRTAIIGINGIEQIVERLIEDEIGAEDTAANITTLNPLVLSSSLKGQLAMLRIARMLAVRGGNQVLQKIDLYGLDPHVYQKELSEIILIALENNPQAVRHVYSLPEPFRTDTNIVECVKYLYQKNLSFTAQCLVRYENEFQWALKNPQLGSIFLACIPYWVKYNSQKLFEWVKSEQFQFFSPAQNALITLSILVESKKNYLEIQPYIDLLRPKGSVVEESIFINLISSLASPNKHDPFTVIKETVVNTWPEHKIDSILGKIAKINNPNNKQSSLEDLLKILLISLIKDKELFPYLLNSNTLNSLFTIHNMHTRKQLIQALQEWVLLNPQIKILFKYYNEINPHSPLSLINILLASIPFSKKEGKQLIDQIHSLKEKNKNYFADNRRFTHLISVLSLLTEEVHKHPNIQKDLFNLIISTLSQKTNLISKVISNIEGILLFAHLPSLIQALNQSDDDISFDEVVKKVFLDCFEMTFGIKVNDPRIVRQFIEKFAESRGFREILVFASKVHKSSDQDYIAYFSDFIESMIYGNFSKKRYAMAVASAHFQRIFNSSENIHSQLLENWKTNTTHPLIPKKTEDYRKQFLELFNHNPLLTDEFPLLYSYITSENALDKINISKQASKDKNRLGLFQRYAITLCSTQTFQTKKTTLEKLKVLELPDDVKNLIGNMFKELIKDKNSLYEGWVIEFTDDPIDLALSGTEIDESCYSLYEDFKTSQCIINLIWDFKTKLIAIKDHTGKIRMRAFIKILDRGDSTPVVFLEKIYTSLGTPPEFRKNIIQEAMDQAQRLQLSFFISKTQMAMRHSPPPLKGSLVSWDSPFGSEYVDALQKQIEKGGRYAIQKHTLYGFNKK